jgi:HK97 gp10 family phage protein
MPEVTTKVEGLRELKANLEKLGADVAKGVMTEGLQAGGKVLMEAIGGVTPVHEGELKAHIMMTTDVAPSGTSGEVKVGFGKQGYKARWVEFGHRMVSHKPDKKEIGHVPAHPFIRPGFDASHTEARNAVIEVIRAKVQSK